jgi:DNA repair photolyase
VDRPPRGRGSASNPTNRFERLRYLEELEVRDEARSDDGAGALRTRFYRDASRSAIATNQSPDLGFDASINPYRGCEHGCSYCYARPTHEYLGWSAGLDFESRILVKEDLPALLRRELAAPAWTPRVIALSGNTDAYQPVERRLRLTRRCLEVLRDFRNPVAVVTKSALVARDADLLAELAADGAASVSVSVTTLEGELARRMEPRAAAPEQRLRAIESLARAGVPVGVMVAPIVPGLNDHEIPAIVSAAASAGARFAGRVVLRLPHGLRELFEDWLERAYPERRAKVLNRMLALHGGRLYDSRFGHRQRGDGRFAEQIDGLFELGLRRAGLAKQRPPLSSAAFRRPAGPQLALFE